MLEGRDWYAERTTWTETRAQAGRRQWTIDMPFRRIDCPAVQTTQHLPEIPCDLDSKFISKIIRNPMRSRENDYISVTDPFWIGPKSAHFNDAELYWSGKL